MKQKGFTLPELLVAVAIVGVLIAVVALVARPRDYTAQRLEATRWLAVAQQMQALSAYATDGGLLPDDLTEEPMLIGYGGAQGIADLCKLLVPKYIKDLARDPEVDANFDEGSCHQADGPGITGLTIAKATDNVVTISAADPKIKLSKQF